ncbi:hypothetical protein [Spirosoma linguale]
MLNAGVVNIRESNATTNRQAKLGNGTGRSAQILTFEPALRPVPVAGG